MDDNMLEGTMQGHVQVKNTTSGYHNSGDKDDGGGSEKATETSAEGSTDT